MQIITVLLRCKCVTRKDQESKHNNVTLCPYQGLNLELLAQHFSALLNELKG